MAKGFDFTKNVKWSLISFAETVNVVSDLGHYGRDEIERVLNNMQLYIELEIESDLNLALKTARKEFKLNGHEDSDKARVKTFF